MDCLVWQSFADFWIDFILGEDSATSSKLLVKEGSIRAGVGNNVYGLPTGSRPNSSIFLVGRICGDYFHLV